MEAGGVNTSPTTLHIIIYAEGNPKFAKQTWWLAVWSPAIKIKWTVEDAGPYKRIITFFRRGDSRIARELKTNKIG